MHRCPSGLAANPEHFVVESPGKFVSRLDADNDRFRCRGHAFCRDATDGDERVCLGKICRHASEWYFVGHDNETIGVPQLALKVTGQVDDLPGFETVFVDVSSV